MLLEAWFYFAKWLSYYFWNIHIFIETLLLKQEGATKDDIERLPKYKFKRIDDFEKENGEIQKRYGGIMVECDTDAPVEHALSEEDAVSFFLHFMMCFI